MTLVEIYKLIEALSLSQPNVHSFVDEFTDLNREDAEYSSVICQQRQHMHEADFMTYNFYLGYADKMSDKEEDEIEIHSTGINILNTIVSALNQNTDLYVTATEFVTARERFTAETAVVYCGISIQVPGACYDSENPLKPYLKSYYTKVETDSAIEQAIDNQAFKTINGQTIQGVGNINISGSLTPEQEANVDMIPGLVDKTAGFVYDPDVYLTTFNGMISVPNLRTNFIETSGLYLSESGEEYNVGTEILRHRADIKALEDGKADKSEIPDVSNFITASQLKTINGESIVGEGDITIEASDTPTLLVHPIWLAEEERYIISDEEAISLKEFIDANGVDKGNIFMSFGDVEADLCINKTKSEDTWDSGERWQNYYIETMYQYVAVDFIDGEIDTIDGNENLPYVPELDVQYVNSVDDLNFEQEGKLAFASIYDTETHSYNYGVYQLTMDGPVKLMTASDVEAEGYVNIDDVNAAIESKGYITQTNADRRYIQATSLTYYYTKAESDAKYAQATSLAYYYTKNEADAKYATITSLANYLPLSGGILTGHLQLGDAQTTAFKQVLTMRNCGSAGINGAAFYTNADGTAAFFHKKYNADGTSATNDAILKFDSNGIYFAKNTSGTASDFKELATKDDITAALGSIDAVLTNILG